MAAYFFASPVDIDIRLEGEEVRKQVEIKLEKERKESCPVYYDGDSIVGQVGPFFPCSYLGLLALAEYLDATGDSTSARWEEADA